MRYDDVHTKVISRMLWGNKQYPTEYDYQSMTIRIREDYFQQMRKSSPLSHHWIYHEFAHHIIAKTFGRDYVINTTGMYPDNRIERFAFAYQFYYLMESHSANTLEDVFKSDGFFRHKRIYLKTLDYYWNNANYIISEFNEEIKKLKIKNDSIRFFSS